MKIYGFLFGDYDMGHEFIGFSTREKAIQYGRAMGWGDNWDELGLKEFDLDPPHVIPPDGLMAYELSAYIRHLLDAESDFKHCGKTEFDGGEYPRIEIETTEIDTTHPSGWGGERIDIGYSIDSWVRVDVLAKSKSEAVSLATKEFWDWMRKNEKDVAKTKEEIDERVQAWRMSQIPDRKK